MTSALLPRRLLEGLRRAGRTAVVLVALLAVFELTSVAHHHASPTEERSCAACQVARNDGADASERTPADLPHPGGIRVPVRRVTLDVADFRAPSGPRPSRGPPPVPPAEQL